MPQFRFYSVRLREPNMDPHWKMGRTLVTFGDSAQDDQLLPLVGAQECPDVLCDSGAFTRHAQTGKITRETYARFLHERGRYFTRYFNFDVMGDHEATAKNQRWLEDKGLKPIPVWHSSSPLPVLEEMMASYDYIAMGQLVGLTPSRRQTVLDAAFALRPRGVKVHLLGVSNIDLLVAYPAYSSDSRAFVQGFLRFHKPRLFCPVRKRGVIVDVRDRWAVMRERALLSLHGLDLMDLPQEENYKLTRKRFFQAGFRSAPIFERCVNRVRSEYGVEPV